jgi:hypothetical protein
MLCTENVIPFVMKTWLHLQVHVKGRVTWLRNRDIPTFLVQCSRKFYLIFNEDFRAFSGPCKGRGYLILEWRCTLFSVPCTCRKQEHLHLLGKRLIMHAKCTRIAPTSRKPVIPLTPELNPSAQRCLTRFFTGDFAYWTVHFVNMCVKTQQMQQLLMQFINYVW